MLEADAKQNDIELISLDVLLQKKIIKFFQGHGSPSGETKGLGDIPYIRVKDIVNWQVYTDITALILWIIIYKVSVYRNNGVLISKGVLSIVLIWIIVNTLWKQVELKRFEADPDSVFVIVLTAASVLYTIFTSLPNLRIWRYYCFVMAVIPIVLWYFVDWLLKKVPLKELTKGWYLIFTISAIITAIMPFVRNNIYYTYDEDKQFESNVREYDDFGQLTQIGRASCRERV